MFEAIISFLSNFALVAVLHVVGAGSFPKPLSAKEEARCLELMKNGDKSARSRLIEHNLRLVAHIVKKYYNAPCDSDDLVSIGTIGLIKALDDTIDTDKDGNALTLIDILADETDIAEQTFLKIGSEKAAQYLEKLPERERDIITLRYGLNGADPLTQKDIAARLGISRSYVSRIEKRAVGLLSEMFEGGQA